MRLTTRESTRFATRLLAISLALLPTATARTQTPVAAPLDLAPGRATRFAADPQRGIVYGIENDGAAGRLWQWDGQRFLRRTVSGTPAAERIAFDEHRRVLVAFASQIIHEFDGAAWRTIAGAMPGSQPVYDAVRRRIVVFGGTALGEWDGFQLVQRPLGNMPSRNGAAIAWHPGLARIVLYGGRSTTGLHDDLWAFDGSTWTLLQTGLPPGPRWRAGMTFDRAGNRLVLHGGDLSGPPTTWALQGATWTPLPPWPTASPANPTNVAPELTADAIGVLVADPRQDCLWRLAGNSPAPIGRPMLGRVAAAFDPLRQRTVVFGGLIRATSSNPYAGYLAATWTLGAEWTRHAPANSPTPRSDAMLAWSANDGSVLLFGGSDDSGPLGDTWLWNGQDWTPRTVAGPGPRFFATAAAEPGGGVLLLGGLTAPTGNALQEAWLWRSSSWTQLSLPSGMDLSRHGAAYDPLRNVTVVGDAAATWHWDGSAWHAVGAPPPYAVRCTFDPVRSRVVASNGALREWTGTAWVQIAAASGAAAPLAIGDPARRRLLEIDSFEFDLAVWTTAAPALETRGAGCAIGAPPPLHALGEPRLGTATFALLAAVRTPGALTALAVDTAYAPAPFGYGCDRYVVPRLVLWQFADARADARFAIPLPDDAALLGLDLWSQAFAHDPARSPSSAFTTTNAMRVTLGR